MWSSLRPGNRRDLIVFSQITQLWHCWSACVPDINCWPQCNSQDVSLWPVNQVQVEVVAEVGCIQYFVGLSWYLPDCLFYLCCLLFLLQVNQLTDWLYAHVLSKLLLGGSWLLELEEFGSQNIIRIAIEVVEVRNVLLHVSVSVFLHGVELALDVCVCIGEVVGLLLLLVLVLRVHEDLLLEKVAVIVEVLVLFSGVVGLPWLACQLV